MLKESTPTIEPNARVLTPLLAALTALTSLSIDMSLPAMPQLQQAFGYLVGLFYDRTPLSLAVTVAAFAGLTLLASGLGVWRGARANELSTDAPRAAREA